MDNNSFEQQFTQKVKATTVPLPTAPIPDNNSSKLPLIIAIVLALVTLIESIILIITLNNYFSITSVEGEEAYEIPEDEALLENAYIYDDDSNLVAMSLSCTNEDGTYYNFNTDNQFEQHNANGALTTSGSYTITNDNLISLSGSNKVLYFDGFGIADGLTIYNCEEVATETDADEGTED